jgi:PhzF family phenazine biosynthesis protein
LGNPVAVVLDGTDLGDEDMQRLAGWTNLSETTFVLPPTTDEADYRLRIFTPGGELPFAGHGTLGSTHAWLQNGGTPAADRVVQECRAGLVHVLRQHDPVRGQDTLSFAAPPTVRTGPLEEEYMQQVVPAFGIDRSQVLAHQWVDNGPGWTVLQLPNAADVLALEPDLFASPGDGRRDRRPPRRQRARLRDAHLRPRRRCRRRPRLRQHERQRRAVADGHRRH